MATVAESGIERPNGAQAAPYHFSVEQYHRMIAAGVFTDADRCELLEGRVVRKVTHNPPHDAALTRLHRRLTRVLSEEWLLRVQCAISTATSEPEPDVAVVRGPEQRYDSRHPSSRDIVFVAEVADSSLEQDRVEKQRIYAGARVPVYWIVNLVGRQIEVHSLPRAGRMPTYRQRRVFQPGERLPVVIDSTEIARFRVTELLP